MLDHALYSAQYVVIVSDPRADPRTPLIYCSLRQAHELGRRSFTNAATRSIVSEQ